MKKLIMVILYIASVSLNGATAYSAEEAKQKITEVSRKIIERTDIPGSDEELRLMLVEFPPGYASPPHLHPVAGLNYIIDGVAESQYEGEDVKTLHAGDSYQDPQNKKHLVFKNPSQTNALRFLVAYKIKKDEAFMQPL